MKKILFAFAAASLLWAGCDSSTPTPEITLGTSPHEVGECVGGGGGSTASTTSAGSGGDGGQPQEVNASDDCAGVEAVTLSLGESFTSHGTTDGMTDDYAGCCGDTTPEADVPEVAYAVVLTQGGVLEFSLVPDGSFDPALSIHEECGVIDPETTYCFDYEGPGATESFRGDFAAGIYFFMVDGSTLGAGDFDLSVSLTARACGDGVLSPGEQCDSGPAAPNDGCVDPTETGECQFEPPTGEDECDGEVVNVPAGPSQLEGQTTLGYADDHEGSCTLTSGGVDRVYQLVPAATGTLTVSVGYELDGVTSTCSESPAPPHCWDQVLYARSTCATPASELDCGDQGWDTPESVTFSVVASEPVFLFVDGYDGEYYSRGEYTLHFQLD